MSVDVKFCLALPQDLLQDLQKAEDQHEAIKGLRSEYSMTENGYRLIREACANKRKRMEAAGLCLADPRASLESSQV